MSQQSRRRRKTPIRPSLPSPSWTGAPCLELVREFNKHFLEELTHIARTEGESSPLSIIRLCRERWLSLDDTARQSAARIPLLLIDMHFRNRDWWRGIRSTALRPRKDSLATEGIHRKVAIDLTYHALVLAWHSARQDQRATSILLAMSPEVAAAIAQLGLRDIRRIAEQHHCHLRPRWEHMPLFWHHLLNAAGSSDDDALHTLYQYAWQLADADSPPSAPGPQPPRSLAPA
jgi:hypothetical protein